MLIDAFLFFNEHELLRVRLDYLGQDVDRFVIVESEFDFAGRRKATHLTKEYLQSLPYAEKIQALSWRPSALQRIVIEAARTSKRSNLLWMIQNWQRNAVLGLMRDLRCDDIILFGDLDEFPSRDSLNEIRERVMPDDQLLGFEQKLFYYNLSNLVQIDWRGTAVCNYRTFRKVTPKYVRKLRNSIPIVGSGWHFSYFTEPMRIREKIAATASVERQEFAMKLNQEEIADRVAGGLDIYERARFRRVDTEKLIPKSLRTSFERFLPASL